jgi:hypothetical protein
VELQTVDISLFDDRNWTLREEKLLHSAAEGELRNRTDWSAEFDHVREETVVMPVPREMEVTELESRRYEPR